MSGFGKKSGATPPAATPVQAIPAAPAANAPKVAAPAPQQPAMPAAATGGVAPIPDMISAHEIANYLDKNLETSDYAAAKRELLGELVDQLDFQAIEQMEDDRKRARVRNACEQLIPKISVPLTGQQIALLTNQSMDEILGFGPIQVLLDDPGVNDIMINTAQRVFIERSGKILLTDVTFLDEGHLLGIIQRIVSRVGRRVDEANPMVDARMPDGSRFNAIIPPLALDGCLVSIRKFKQSKMLLDQYLEYDSLTQPMANLLKIAGRIRLNIIISGGTGSGKTTLLNALSANIEHDERVITIEDAAELQLKQPHVLRLETRPASIEGKGEINQRQLVRNALRMRPDRIILGEIRGDEVIDVLSAMNTGHDGSMATIHANTPRDCLSRLENLVAMSSVNIPTASLRYQISSAVHLIVQIQRMNDGKRRITQIEEIAGIESGNILSQTLFQYKIKGKKTDGSIDGEFIANPVTPQFMSQAEYFGLKEELQACLPSIA